MVRENGFALYIDEITAIYRYHNGGVYSTISTEKRLRINIEVYRHLLALNDFIPYRKYIFQKLSSMYYFLGRTSNSESSAIIYFLQSFEFFSLKNVKYPVLSLLRLGQLKSKLFLSIGKSS
jgi:hypothetical protein